MILSLAFSVIIFQVAANEIRTRVDDFQSSVKSTVESDESSILDTILHASEGIGSTDELVVVLIYVNVFVFIEGGFLSYFLACRSLVPIRKVHEAQSRFTSDASHELRTPLAIMKTELEVALRDKNATTKSLKLVLSSNLEEVDKLTKLAEMLLKLSQLDINKLKLGPINLNKTTRSAVDGFKKSNRTIKLGPGQQQIVYGNETAVLELVNILIDNAVQYSPELSTIDINILRQNDDEAKFEISNTGPGILPEKLPYIFERFYRADTSRTNTHNKGYGLGLALAKNIAELHNGSLSVNSIPNNLTTFTLILPLKSNTKNK